MLKSILSVGVLLAATNAAAEPAIAIAGAPVEVVKVGDLDLASARGQNVLQHRLAGAIEAACGSFANVTESSEEFSIRDCRNAAWQSARRQLAARSAELHIAEAKPR